MENHHSPLAKALHFLCGLVIGNFKAFGQMILLIFAMGCICMAMHTWTLPAGVKALFAIALIVGFIVLVVQGISFIFHALIKGVNQNLKLWGCCLIACVLILLFISFKWALISFGATLCLMIALGNIPEDHHLQVCSWTIR